MARRKRRNPQLREIHIAFEPNRLSPSWVAQAYEEVIPIVRRTPQRPSHLNGDGLPQREKSSPKRATAYRR